MEKLTESEIISKILANGGVIIVHKNDIERLKGIAKSKECELLITTRIFVDKNGIVPEGAAIATAAAIATTLEAMDKLNGI